MGGRWVDQCKTLKADETCEASFKRVDDLTVQCTVQKPSPAPSPACVINPELDKDCATLDLHPIRDPDSGVYRPHCDVYRLECSRLSAEDCLKPDKMLYTTRGKQQCAVWDGR